MKSAARVAFVLAVIAIGWCQQESRGAKALFDAVHFKAQPSPAAPNKPPSSPVPAGTGLVENVGIKYWVELIQPGNAQITRVNSNRIFHSGERMRLHIETNVDGRITLLQLRPDGTAQILFPDARINGGNNDIQAGIDMQVPSSTAWIRFDNNPGIERLVIFLSPVDRRPMGEGGAPPRQADAQGQSSPSNGTASGDGEPDLTQIAAFMSMWERLRGGKGVTVEVDDQAEKPASYAVLTAAGNPSTRPRDPLAIEIQFRHQ